jgi:hypothetical protein
MNSYRLPGVSRAREELNIGDREDTGHDRRSALLTVRSYRLRQGLFKTIVSEASLNGARMFVCVLSKYLYIVINKVS